MSSLKYHPLETDHLNPDHTTLQSQPSKAQSSQKLITREAFQSLAKQNPNPSKKIPLNTLQYTAKQQNIDQICFTKNLRALHTVNIKETLALGVFVPALKHLKSLKSLKYLNINLHCIPHTPEQMIKIIKILPQALQGIRRLQNLKVKLTISADYIPENKGWSRLLRCFSQLETLSTIDMTFPVERDASRVQEFITIIKHWESLSDLSLTFELCNTLHLIRFQSPLLILAEMKSLKNVKICFKRCSPMTSEDLEKLVPIVKQVAQTSDINIIFDHCFTKVNMFQWWRFVWSIKRIKSCHKIQTKWIGEKSGQALIVLIVSLILGICIAAIMDNIFYIKN